MQSRILVARQFWVSLERLPRLFMSTSGNECLLLRVLISLHSSPSKYRVPRCPPSHPSPSQTSTQTNRQKKEWQCSGSLRTSATAKQIRTSSSIASSGLLFCFCIEAFVPRMLALSFAPSGPQNSCMVSFVGYPKLVNPLKDVEVRVVSRDTYVRSMLKRRSLLLCHRSAELWLEDSLSGGVLYHCKHSLYTKDRFASLPSPASWVSWECPP